MTPIARKDRAQIIIGALCWIAKLEFFAAEYIAAAAWPGYSFRDNTISLLGAHTCGAGPAGGGLGMCSPLYWVMNGGLILAGLLTIAGAVLTRKAWPATRPIQIALTLVIIAGIGTVGIGIWPVDGNEILHVASTLTTFVPGCIGVMLLGAVMTPHHRVFGIITVLFGAVSLGALALFGAHIYLGFGHGGMERVAGNASTLWYVVAGGFILISMRMRAQLA